jgi:parallel beta-helix repeat protein
MLRYRVLLGLAALMFWAPSLFGSSVQVGTCKPHLTSFSTISAAVGGVPAGSTIQVCPGTYAEQITITQPVNLVGVTSGTANEVVIAVPPAGLLPNTTSMFGESVAAQVLVLEAGSVNITNIAVDGTGGDMGCLSNVWVAGIFYGSGSSGTVNRVRASGQVDATCGVGIWVENSDTSNQAVNIRNSSVCNVDSAGIFAGSGTTPTLSVSLNNNVVSASSAVADIDVDSVNGTVSNGNISNGSFGVFDSSSGVSVTANRIIGSTTGIYLANGGTASNNQVSGGSEGILLGASGATINGNTIVSNTTAGVELGCFAASLNGNTINDAPVGLDSVSPSVGLGTNNFFNTTTTMTGGCAGEAIASPRAMAMRTNVSSNGGEQWHTPATPFGTRTK